MKMFGAAVLLSLALAAPAMAQAPGDPVRQTRLDALFTELKGAKSESDGLRIEEQIVHIWLQSGDAAIDEKMEWARLAMDNNSADLALGYLNSIILNKPDYVEGWNQRATLFFYTGRYKESLADIDKTLALEPRHFGAIAGKGMVKEALGDEAGALEAFKQALAIDPQLTNVQLEVFLLEDKLKGKRI